MIWRVVVGLRSSRRLVGTMFTYVHKFVCQWWPSYDRKTQVHRGRKITKHDNENTEHKGLDDILGSTFWSISLGSLASELVCFDLEFEFLLQNSPHLTPWHRNQQIRETCWCLLDMFQNKSEHFGEISWTLPRYVLDISWKPPGHFPDISW